MKRSAALILLLFFVNAFGYSQEGDIKDPKVGLVLSGGGAKGLAHIGTLKVIDSLGIRIDHVAGTSMGAIIGSLYAAGYSGKQLDSIFQDINFDDILSDNIPRGSKTFYERENDEKYAAILPFDRFIVKLPSAISSGQNTFNLLSKLTLHVSDINDFEKLPIPFFCMATNIENGQAVMLDKGNLAQAIKASGAFPSLYQPVLIEDQLLIDGGVTNNYPIDELKEKGMDVIIGVDVQDGLSNRMDLSSAPQILFQINNFRTIDDMKIKSKKTDIYIKPDIEDFNFISFSQGNQIIKNGEIATKLKLKELQQLVNKQTKKRSPFYEGKTPDSIQINQVYFKGLNKYTKSYTIGKLKLETKEKTSYHRFLSGTNNLIATNNFDTFTYKLVPSSEDKEGGYDLYGELKETNKTTFLKFGLHYDGLYKSALLANFTKKQLLFKSDVLSLDLIFGDNTRYNFEYYIDKGYYWSFGVGSRYNEFNKSVAASIFFTPQELALAGVNKIDVKYTDLTNKIFARTQYKNDLTLTLGLEHKRYKVKTETVIASSDTRATLFDNSDYVSAYGNLQFDSFDDKHFPSEGFYFNGDFNLYLYSSDFNGNFSEFSALKADIGYAYRFKPKLSANILGEAGTLFNAKDNRSFDFVLGGYANNFINNFKSFYGYDYLSIDSTSFLKATLNLDYEIFKKNHIILSANFANVQDDLFTDVDFDWLAFPAYTGYALGYSLETFLGPVEAKYTWSPELRENYWFFNLGFWF